jgi:hypothetical protein
LAVAVVAAALLASPAGAATVEYRVGAVPTTWNVVPSGKDPMTGQSFDPAKTTMQTTIYRGFSANWASQLPPGNAGFGGPLLRARVGDTILVHFKNFDTARPRSPAACTAPSRSSARASRPREGSSSSSSRAS